MNVLILQGGHSPEREVSLRSADNVARAIRTLGYDFTTYDPQQGFNDMLPLLARADVVFPVLHGQSGEDGTVQQFLEDYRAAFVGSDAEASRRCFDKIAAKHILEENGISTPQWEEVNRDSFVASELAKKPFVLKPRGGGSSIDTFIVRDPAKQSIDMSVFDRYDTMLLEEVITGTELTVGILGGDTLPVVEIVPPHGKEFDYDNKYNGKTKELCPPGSVDQAMQEEAQDLAASTHDVLGARHFSRVDIMMSTNGEFYVLELNTIPGLTEQSLLPKAAAVAGLPMSALTDQLLNLALHSE